MEQTRKKKMSECKTNTCINEAMPDDDYCSKCEDGLQQAQEMKDEMDG